ncbi:hypothetical protein J6590_094316 [Homalodisca vitripennis]|nr:hypothetical protein J6590_026577 [Homalodisca vitripennis]KAG8319326.1 hypothetical protein J6590_094316 [Homalodisca vitripennis]
MRVLVTPFNPAAKEFPSQTPKFPTRTRPSPSSPCCGILHLNIPSMVFLLKSIFHVMGLFHDYNAVHSKEPLNEELNAVICLAVGLFVVGFLALGPSRYKKWLIGV